VYNLLLPNDSQWHWKDIQRINKKGETLNYNIKPIQFILLLSCQSETLAGKDGEGQWWPSSTFGSRRVDGRGGSDLRFARALDMMTVTPGQRGPLGRRAGNRGRAKINRGRSFGRAGRGHLNFFVLLVPNPKSSYYTLYNLGLNGLASVAYMPAFLRPAARVIQVHHE